MNDIDVSELSEWKVEPVEGADVMEDMTVLVKTQFNAVVKFDAGNIAEFEFGGWHSRGFKSTRRASTHYKILFILFELTHPW
jgi:hypothetical protein